MTCPSAACGTYDGREQNVVKFVGKAYYIWQKYKQNQYIERIVLLPLQEHTRKQTCLVYF